MMSARRSTSAAGVGSHAELLALWLLLAAVIAAPALGQPRITARTGVTIALSVSAADGVRTGQTGSVVQYVKASGVERRLPIARFLVERVDATGSWARLTQVGDGFDATIMPGLEVLFDDNLVPATATPRPSGASAVAAAPSAAEIAYWDSIKDSRDPADFESYLRRFPGGLFADLARNRIRSLRGGTTQAAVFPQFARPQGPPAEVPATSPAAAAVPAVPSAPTPVVPTPTPTPPLDAVYVCSTSAEFNVDPEEATVEVEGRVIGIADDWDGSGSGRAFPLADSGTYYVRLTHPKYRTVWVRIVADPQAHEEVCDVDLEMRKARR